MAKLISNIGKQFVNEDIDVRSKLRQSFLVGASVEEACAYAGVPLDVFRDWEYTYIELDKIKAYMYSNKLKEYKDITPNEDINIELLDKLVKNNNYGIDIYTLIKQCKEAQAEIVIYHLSNIRQPKKKKDTDWKASAWWLERTNPERYGKDSKGDKEEKVVEKISVEFVGSDSQESINRLKELEKEVKESLNIVDEN